MFGTEVRRRRLERGWTQEKLAEKAGLTPHYVSSLENGHRDPSLSTVESLARAFGLAAGEFLGAVTELSPSSVDLAKRFQKLPEGAQRVLLELIQLLERSRR